MTDINAESDISAALAHALPSVQVAPIPGVDAVVVSVRNDARARIHQIEPLLPAPARTRGDVHAVSAEGFLDAVRRRDVGDTTIYADDDQCTLVAILNDDHGATTGWRDHRVTLDLRPTPAWTHWTSNQGFKSQTEFAEIIEEGEEEIQEPSPTTMLEIAQTFHAAIGAKFKQGGRLTDGRVQLVYEEEIDANAGQDGTLTIPPEFVLAIKPFYGADPYRVKARLRYRLGRGEAALSIGYFLHRIEDIRRAAFGDIVTLVSEANVAEVIAASAPGRVDALGTWSTSD